MKTFLFDCGPRDTGTSLGLLVLRIGTGLLMLFGHGLSKLQGFSEMKSGFKVPDFFPLNYMSSPVSLSATIFAEVGCAALLVLGLATRPAAFVLAFTMTVAAFNIHAAGPLFMSGGPGAKEPAILFLIPCIALLLSGAGVFSADSLILKERRRNW
ncbi:MAG: DoxX family protein [Verrucomicrobiota bacterium]